MIFHSYVSLPDGSGSDPMGMWVSFFSPMTSGDSLQPVAGFQWMAVASWWSLCLQITVGELGGEGTEPSFEL